MVAFTSIVLSRPFARSAGSRRFSSAAPNGDCGFPNGLARAARGSAPQARRLGATLLLLTISGIGFWPAQSSATSVFTTQAKVQEGVTLSSVHRTAIGIACAEETLRPGMSASELELLPPSNYQGTYVKSVVTKVESLTRAMVVITYKRIGTVIKDGELLVYFGTCSRAGTFWEVRGTLPKRYWPRQ